MPNLTPPPGYNLFFSDEFNYTGSVDPEKWLVDANPFETPPTVNGSNLVLSATGTDEASRLACSIWASDSTSRTWWPKEPATGVVNMWPPGCLEVSMKPSEIAGLLSTILIYSPITPFPVIEDVSWQGEIDVVEARGFQPGIMECTTHGWYNTSAPPGGPEVWDRQIEGSGTIQVATDSYHQFVAWWGPEFVRLYVNGFLLHDRRVTNDLYRFWAGPMAFQLASRIGEDGEEFLAPNGVDYPVDTAAYVDYVRFYVQGAW